MNFNISGPDFEEFCSGYFLLPQGESWYFYDPLTFSCWNFQELFSSATLRTKPWHCTHGISHFNRHISINSAENVHAPMEINHCALIALVLYSSTTLRTNLAVSVLFGCSYDQIVHVVFEAMVKPSPNVSLPHSICWSSSFWRLWYLLQTTFSFVELTADPEDIMSCLWRQSVWICMHDLSLVSHQVHSGGGNLQEDDCSFHPLVFSERLCISVTPTTAAQS